MQAVALGGFLLSFLLSGLIFPIENIPDALRWISNLVQARYYIVVVRDAFLQGGGWPAVWWAVLADRRHRPRVLRAGVADDAAHAGEGVRRSGAGCSAAASGRWRSRSCGRSGATGGSSISLIVPPMLAGPAVRLRAGLRGAEPAPGRRRREPHAREPRAGLGAHARTGRSGWPAAYDTTAVLGDALAAGRLDVGVVVPYDFARRRVRGRRPRCRCCSTPPTPTPRRSRRATWRAPSPGSTAARRGARSRARRRVRWERGRRGHGGSAGAGPRRERRPPVGLAVPAAGDAGDVSSPDA